MGKKFIEFQVYVGDEQSMFDAGFKNIHEKVFNHAREIGYIVEPIKNNWLLFSSNGVAKSVSHYSKDVRWVGLEDFFDMREIDFPKFKIRVISETNVKECIAHGIQMGYKPLEGRTAYTNAVGSHNYVLIFNSDGVMKTSNFTQYPLLTYEEFFNSTFEELVNIVNNKLEEQRKGVSG